MSTAESYDGNFEEWERESRKPELLSRLGSRAVYGQNLDISVDEQADLVELVGWMDRFRSSHRLGELQPLISSHSIIRAKRWESSGLVATYGFIDSIEDLSVSSLIHSVRSGKIRAVTYDHEPSAELLRKVTEQLSGHEIELGNDDLVELRTLIDASERQQEFLDEMLSEAKDKPYEGKYRAGPHKHFFRDLTESTQLKLARIDPRLTMNALHDSDYQDPDTLKLTRKLRSNGRSENAMMDVRQYWTQGLFNIAKANLPETREHTIDEGILDVPEFTLQTQLQTCANTAFRMVYQGVSGETLNEVDLLEATKKHHKTHLTYDEEYLKLFETEAFKQNYDVRAQSMQFMGMTLESISNVVTLLKSKRPKAKVFVVVGLQTDQNARWNTQHRAILCKAGYKTVTMLDPKYEGITTIRKDTFLHRWARAQNSGYLVIAA